MTREIMVGRVLAAIAIALNVVTMVSAVRRARASRQPKTIEHTIVMFLIVVSMLLPFLLGTQRVSVFVVTCGLAVFLALVHLWRVVSRSD